MLEQVIITADVHLVPDIDNKNHPINQNFYHFLTATASQAKELYIIGDLFEIWVGDDINIAEYQTVINLLKQLTDKGLKIYLMYGNRDFLMGKKFWKATGIVKLNEPTIIKKNGISIILVHGDHLCTDDKPYQKMRRLFRNKMIQWFFFKLPKTKRIAIGEKMRQQSQQKSSKKPNNIMDVNQQAVIKLFNQHPSCNHLIHGHTHQPAKYEFILDNKSKHRWVLGDWRPEAKYIVITPQIQFKNTEKDAL
jgi:UDP-2,3-diacylglucosamine hydrolase